MQYHIRVAREDDAAALVDIYAPYVRETAITFEYDVPTVEEFAGRIRHTLSKYPYLVAEDGQRLLGYAYVSTFHDRPAYDWAVETSIYIRRDVRKQGLGKALYAALEQALRAQGILNLNACVAYPPEESARLTRNSADFHEHLGYRMVGRFHRCGYKFNTWYDMVWLEKEIGPHLTEQPPVKPFLSVLDDIGYGTLTARVVQPGTVNAEQLAALYVRAFPKNERIPLAALLDGTVGENLAFYEGERFVGFLCALNVDDLCHITYFATEEGLRGHGYGTRMLAALRAMKPGCRILADVEAVTDDAPNREEREHRRNFYLHCGYAPTPVHYDWQGEAWEILANGGSVTEAEFDDFWARIAAAQKA